MISRVTGDSPQFHTHQDASSHVTCHLLSFNVTSHQTSTLMPWRRTPSMAPHTNTSTTPGRQMVIINVCPATPHQYFYASQLAPTASKRHDGHHKHTSWWVATSPPMWLLTVTNGAGDVLKPLWHVFLVFLSLFLYQCIKNNLWLNRLRVCSTWTSTPRRVTTTSMSRDGPTHTHILRGPHHHHLT